MQLQKIKPLWRVFPAKKNCARNVCTATLAEKLKEDKKKQKNISLPTSDSAAAGTLLYQRGRQVDTVS